MQSEVKAAVDFSFIRYSVVWEDIDLLYRALRIGPDDDVLSITSAGCNVLGLLLHQPRSLIAIDLNPTQNALLELKMAGIRQLDHDDFLAFIGIRPAANRTNTYRMIRYQLLPETRAYWDSQADMIETGVIFGGKLERYIRTWQKEHLAAIHPPEKINYLLQLDNLATQQAFFETEWASPAFEKSFKHYFGNHNLQKGRDPVLFRYVQIDAGTHFFERFRHVCTRLPLRGNFYVEFFLTSAYRDLQQVHPYLKASNYGLLRSQLEKVQIVTADLESFLTRGEYGRFSKANLSNIFEYMSPENAAHLLGLLHRNFRTGGTLAYWNLLVPRSCPDHLRSQFISHIQDAQILWQADRSWFYRDFVVEEVR
jgi:S-adenosylmethionine-diacylglycerol 3-amino-3-carboxypropyl transferase